MRFLFLIFFLFSLFSLTSFSQTEIGAYHAQPATTSVSGTSTITTNSTTAVLMTGMTITPPAGTYQVFFNTYVDHNTSNATLDVVIYVGGSAVAASVRSTQPRVVAGLNAATPITQFIGTIAEVTVNGSQAIEGRWFVSSGTGTAYERTLNILRVR